MKNINFYPWSEFGINKDFSPAPAYRFIPKWLSSMSRFFNNEKKPRITAESEINVSVKGCPPFVDSMLSGYIIPLPADVMIEKNQNGSFDFLWKSDIKLVTGHAKEQISPRQVSKEYHDEPFKWINHWSIELPAGYSALFTHPLNRTDLPFHTLSGIVDSDSYKMPIHFPFFLKQDFEGVIPAGTPIVQIIPLKREPWSHKVFAFSKKKVDLITSKFRSFVFSGYKKAYWNRKEYK